MTDVPSTQSTEGASAAFAAETTKTASAGNRARLDSPLRTMFGLLILWGSLLLIFTAHRISDPYIHMVTSGAKTPAEEASLAKSMGPREIMTQPFTMSMFNTTPRAAMSALVAQCGFHLRADELKNLGETSRHYAINKPMPLYKVIHQVIDNPAIGYAVKGRTIQFFPQKLDVSSSAQHKYMLDWTAELALSDEPMMIAPTDSSDIWFSVQMIRDVNQANKPWRTIEVGVFKGAECQTNSRAQLDETGKALLSMSTREAVNFQVERKAQAQESQAPGRYQVRFYYQSFD